MANPLMPGPLDVVVVVLVIAACIFTVLALISAIRAPHVTGMRFLLWFIAIVFLPILGPTAWFIRGRGSEVVRSSH